MIIQPPLPIYSDERGEIETVTDGEFSSVLRITSAKGSSRALHYHLKDTHICYLEFGSIEYYERPVGSLEVPTLTIIKPGQTFFTDSNIEHQMFFPVDSLFWCFSKLSRKQENYETDTIRLKFSLKEIDEQKL